MVWNFDVSFGLNSGMPYLPAGYNFCMPNYCFIQSNYYTNPIQTPFHNNYQVNPFYSTNILSQINFSTTTPFITNYIQPNINTMLTPYYQPFFSASEHIKASSSDSSSQTSSKSNSNDPFAEYDKDAGNLLAQNAIELSHEFHNKCSLHVNKAIETSGLGSYTDADAYEMINILDSNPKFKSISNDTDVTKLPAGCIVVYDKGVAGYSDEFGHVEIASGDGRGVSDGINDEIKPNPTAIYMPIST